MIKKYLTLTKQQISKQYEISKKLYSIQKNKKMKASMLKQFQNAKLSQNLGKTNKNSFNQNKEIKVTQNAEKQKQQQNLVKEKVYNKSQRNIFKEYIELLKRKVLKRKIILFFLNIILTLITIVFCLFFVLWSSLSESQQIETKIQQIFSIQFSLVTLGCLILIGILSMLFSIIIINGKVIFLHCYWISCLLFLIVFSVISASAFSIVNMNCEEPSSYILQKLKQTNQQASRIFCSDTCPCELSLDTENNLTKYGKVQDCPEWSEIVYSSFFNSIQQNFKCSGWCHINPKSYYTFLNGQQAPDINNQKSCFESIQDKVQSDTKYFRILCIILCFTLILVIFYTNYYIFMEKQDQNRQAKKLKRKILQNQQIMQDQLRTSKRMLS